MRIFEPHAHMYARTTNDYEAMAAAGIEAIVEPAFWLGEERKHAGSFFDYFNHLHNYEHARAATYGIQQFITLAMNPKEANNRELNDAVVKELPRFLDLPRVVAVGEIGFDQITPAEEDSFCAQAEMARRHGLPILIHSAHVDKKRSIERMFVLLSQMNYPMEKVLMDHNVEDTTPITRSYEAWAGHTVYPISKVSPERMARILAKEGFDMMMVNSACDWGASDPLMIPYTVEELRARSVSEADISKLVWDNPVAFFKQSGRLTLS